MHLSKTPVFINIPQNDTITTSKKKKRSNQTFYKTKDSKYVVVAFFSYNRFKSINVHLKLDI
jgi:hypothetical protein